MLIASIPFDNQPLNPGGVVQFQTIIGYTAWIADALILIALIVVGAMMAVQHHRGQDQNEAALGKVVIGALIVGGASTLAGTLFGFNLFTSNATAIPGLSGVQTVIGWVSYIAAALCIIGVIVVGAMMAISHRRNEPIGQWMGAVFAGCVIVGGAATFAGVLLP